MESVNTPRLLPGSRGAKVKTLQLLLTQQGLYAGSANGVFGPSTVRAVKQFQEQTKVVPDGIVGPQTLQALIKANPTSFTKPGVLVFVGVKVEGFRVRQFGPLQANLCDSATDVRVQGRGAVPIVQLLRPLLPPEKVKAAVRLGSITKSRATVRPYAPIDQRGKLLWVAAPRNASTFFVRVELHDLSGELIDFADTSTFRLPIRR